MIYDRFDEKITIKSRDSVSQPTWGGPGYVGKTGTHSNAKSNFFRRAKKLTLKIYMFHLSHNFVILPSCYSCYLVHRTTKPI